MLRYMPEEVQEQEDEVRNRRGVEVAWRELGNTGTVALLGELYAPDALSLEQAISTGAAWLKDRGSKESLDVCRAWALGDLARSTWRDTPAPTQNLLYHPDCACGRALSNELTRPHWGGTGARTGRINMYIHLTSMFHAGR